MNSQAEILRQTLESMANGGNPQFQMFGFDPADVGVSEQRATKIAAKNILEQFPEEDSEHVKAYRALVFLSEYVEEHALNDELPTMGYPLEDQLRSLRNKVAQDARDDIVGRLEIDRREYDPTNSITHMTSITDPISKAHLRVSNPSESHQESNDRAEKMSHEILEAPL